MTAGLPLLFSYDRDKADILLFLGVYLHYLFKKCPEFATYRVGVIVGSSNAFLPVFLVGSGGCSLELNV